MKSIGKLHIERFRAAVAAGDDAKTEALVPFLTAADLPILYEMATAQDVDQRWWAIRAVGEVGDAASIPLLADGIADADPAVRAVTAMAVGEIQARHPEAENELLAALVALLGDEDGQVREAAVTGLAHCGEAAVPLLSAALDGNQDGPRVLAARTLHRIGTLSTAPALYRHLEDANPWVCHYAYETLDRLGLLENLLFRR